MDRDSFYSLLNDSIIDIESYQIIIFGLGNTFGLYHECFLREKLNVVAYSDNDPKKLEIGEINGKPVIEPKSIMSYDNPYVLICSAQYNAIKIISEQMNSMGIPNSTVDRYIFAKHKQEVMLVYDMLQDALSKETYSAMVVTRMLGVKMDSSIYCDNAYFCLPEFRRVNDKQVFVDCGAYVGDSLEKYIWTHSGCFDKAIAFEPDKGNYKALEQRTNRLVCEWNLKSESIKLVQSGVGIRSQTLNFITSQSASGFGSRIDYENTHVNNGDMQIDIIALDDYFANDRISFIKADIESNEMLMLHGAKKVISRDLPNMAICIYHNALDMFEIPLYIMQEFGKKYRIYIRHHDYSYSETVLYATAEQ